MILVRVRGAREGRSELDVDRAQRSIRPAAPSGRARPAGTPLSPIRKVLRRPPAQRSVVLIFSLTPIHCYRHPYRGETEPSRFGWGASGGFNSGAKNFGKSSRSVILFGGHRFWYFDRIHPYPSFSLSPKFSFSTFILTGGE